MSNYNEEEPTLDIGNPAGVTEVTVDKRVYRVVPGTFRETRGIYTFDVYKRGHFNSETEGVSIRASRASSVIWDPA